MGAEHQELQSQYTIRKNQQPVLEKSKTEDSVPNIKCIICVYAYFYI